MAKHFELSEPNAIHPAAFVGTVDPAGDPDNNVQAFKLWVDTTGGPPYALKIRNSTNTGWESVSGGSASTSAVAGPPGFGEEGEEGQPGPPGSSSSSSSFAATLVGQVLISVNGSTFEAKLPVNDSTVGWLVDGVTGLMIVS